MSKLYYREKIISLTEKLFVETGDARSRIISCEEKIISAQLASNSEDVPEEIKVQWRKFINEFSQKEDLIDNKGRIIQSSLSSSIGRKRNKSMIDFLLFILEEFYRVYKL